MNDSHHPSTRYRLALVSAVVWTALILGLYYWVHKPLTPPLARALGGAILDVVTALIFVIAGGGLGRWILRSLLPDRTAWSAPERIAADALTGLGLLSLLVMVIGALWLHLVSIGALMLVVIVLARRDVIAWGRDLIEGLRGAFSDPPADRWARFVLWTALILAGFALIMATLPPTKWDVLTYHLAGPEQYVKHGRFYAVPYNHFLGFPQLVDTLFAGQLALTGQLAGGGVLHWYTGLLMLAITGGYTARHGWIALVVLSPPLRRMERGPGGEVNHQSAIIVCGLVAGLAIGTKYTAFWIACAVVVETALPVL